MCDPSESITQTAESSPSWFESNAIFVPSGDQLGLNDDHGASVSRVADPLPLELMTSIEHWLNWQLENAILSPPGE